MSRSDSYKTCPWQQPITILSSAYIKLSWKNYKLLKFDKSFLEMRSYNVNHLLKIHKKKSSLAGIVDYIIYWLSALDAPVLVRLCLGCMLPRGCCCGGCCCCGAMLACWTGAAMGSAARLMMVIRLAPGAPRACWPVPWPPVWPLDTTCKGCSLLPDQTKYKLVYLYNVVMQEIGLCILYKIYTGKCGRVFSALNHSDTGVYWCIIFKHNKQY